jgi:HSP20 family protein
MKIEVNTGGWNGAEPGASRPGRFEERTTETRQTSVRYRETPEALELKIDMPGAKADNLSVSLRGRKLSVEFEKRDEVRSTEGGVERVETQTEKRTKEVELPSDVDADKVDAVYKDGILTVTLGKR